MSLITALSGVLVIFTLGVVQFAAFFSDKNNGAILLPYRGEMLQTVMSDWESLTKG